MQLKFYDNDPELLLFSQMDHGYPVHQLIQSLLGASIDEDRICKVQLFLHKGEGRPYSYSAHTFNVTDDAMESILVRRKS